MRALNRKLLRDLWQLRSQSLAIIAVIGTGVAMFAMYLSTFDSLERTRSNYYESERFAQVFAHAKRAPLWIAERIGAIPGVDAVETRIVVDVTLDVPGVEEPSTGRLISIPEVDRDTLNDVILRRGRYVDPAGRDEILVHESFAEEHGLEPGDRLAAVINGRRRELSIAGIALSPEYIYVIGPGDLVPDHRRFGVLWMGRRALAAAFDLEGGFNSVALSLSRTQDTDSDPTLSVIDELDRILARYGGLGAIAREHQSSHWFIENELRELSTMASILPMIFLAVAAFLMHIVLSRTIAVQRTQIAALKALGYDNREIGLHYFGLGAMIALVASLVGNFAGARLGRGLTGIYAEYFRFPHYVYELAPSIALGSAAISLIAAGFGTSAAIRRAIALPPAEAMRPEPPPRFEPTAIERMGLREFLGPAGRMVVRNLARRPWRSTLSSLGIAMSIALLILGSFFLDALDYLVDLQFGVAQRHDLAVSFVEPKSSEARFELERLPGVLFAEGFRSVPVRLRKENRSRQTAILGLSSRPKLSRIVDRERGIVTLPEQGLVLSESLADILGAKRGDLVEVEVLEGARRHHVVPLAETVKDLLGLSAYMEAEALATLMREDLSLSGAFLTVDDRVEQELYRQLKDTPGVAGVSLTRAAVRSFEDTIQGNMARIIAFNIAFSTIIAIGVVYNAARISLSERSRDLASLRVLGFSQTEVSMILLGELAVVALAAIPFGMLFGRGLAALMLELLHNEMYRIPLIIDASTYGQAIATTMIASLVSALLVRRRLARLDLVGVLKTRD